MVVIKHSQEIDMPDITMCSNNNCPVRNTCYRHTAKPSEIQSYAVFQFDTGFIGVLCDNRIAIDSPMANELNS